jgi:hypothetical protein
MDEAKEVDERLNTIKENFVKETQKDGEKFRVGLEDVAKEFQTAAQNITGEGADLDED